MSGALEVEVSTLDWNVEVIAAAVGDSPDPARFAPSSDPRQGRLDASGALEVAGTSLDAEVFARRIPVPQVIKVGIEGAEAQALSGARSLLLEARPRVWIETHGWQAHEECLEAFRSLGYRIADEQAAGSSGYGRLLACHGTTAAGAGQGRTSAWTGAGRAKGLA